MVSVSDSCRKHFLVLYEKYQKAKKKNGPVIWAKAVLCREYLQKIAGPDKEADIFEEIFAGLATEEKPAAFQDFQLHPVEGTDAAFRNLISEAAIQRMKDSLISPNLSLNEMISFDGEPVALGTPTFEGKEGKKFRRILQSF